AAGPSMPNVYSPAGLACTLSNNFDWAKAGENASTTKKTLLHRHKKFLADVKAIVVAALAVQIKICRPEKTAEARFVYSAPLCHDDDLPGRDFAAFLAGFGGELAGGRSGLDAHPRSRNHFGDQRIRRVEQPRIARLGPWQALAAWRHQLLRAKSTQS